jgi:hypothetical protein
MKFQIKIVVGVVSLLMVQTAFGDGNSINKIGQFGLVGKSSDAKSSDDGNGTFSAVGGNVAVAVPLPAASQGQQAVGNSPAAVADEYLALKESEKAVEDYKFCSFLQESLDGEAYNTSKDIGYLKRVAAIINKNDPAHAAKISDLLVFAIPHVKDNLAEQLIYSTKSRKFYVAEDHEGQSIQVMEWATPSAKVGSADMQVYNSQDKHLYRFGGLQATTDKLAAKLRPGNKVDASILLADVDPDCKDQTWSVYRYNDDVAPKAMAAKAVAPPVQSPLDTKTSIAEMIQKAWSNLSFSKSKN